MFGGRRVLQVWHTLLVLRLLCLALRAALRLLQESVTAPRPSLHQFLSVSVSLFLLHRWQFPPARSVVPQDPQDLLDFRARKRKAPQSAAAEVLLLRCRICFTTGQLSALHVQCVLP